MKNQKLCFLVCEKISVAGHKVNEDAVGAQHSLAWVLDGASTRIDYSLAGSTAASRLVESLGTQLSEADTTSRRARNILKNAIQHTSKEWGIVNKRRDDEDQPSCTAGLALLRRNICEVCVLGDITIVWQSHRLGVTRLYTDPAAAEREKRINQELRSLINSGRSIKDARELVWNATRADRRRLMNRPGGYWSITIDPAAADHAAVFEIQVKPDDRILIASDGFARLVDLFGILSWREAMTALGIHRETLQSLMDLIRKLEAEDSRCMRFPRMSPSDDASAIYLTVQEDAYYGRL